jgi:hypothetical protein
MFRHNSLAFVTLATAIDISDIWSARSPDLEGLKAMDFKTEDSIEEYIRKPGRMEVCGEVVKK